MSIEDISKLLEYIEGNLKPKDKEKKERGEVFTPISLIEEMLDKLPSEVWNNPNLKWLDPAAGIGNFPIIIYLRLMKGLGEDIPDEETRRKHILEKMLFMVEINPNNVSTLNRIFCGDKYRLNIFEGSFIDGNDIDRKPYERVFNPKMDFDVVVGNPPYSTDPSKQNTIPLYNLFIEKFIDMGRLLIFVIPSKWFSGGKGLDKFRAKMKSRRDMRLIRHIDNSSDWFGKEISLKGGACYFIKDSSYSGLCNFNGVDIDLSEYDIVLKPEHHALAKRIQDLPKIDSIYMSRGFYKIETNDKRLTDNPKIDSIYMSSGFYKIRTNDKRLTDNKTSKDSVPVWVSSLKTKSRKMYINISECSETKEKTWKVVTSRANGKGSDGFGFKAVSSPEELYTDSYVAFRAKSKEEAESIKSYLECKFPNRILAIRKITQDINTATIKWIPIVPFDRIWTDEAVNKFFGF